MNRLAAATSLLLGLSIFSGASSSSDFEDLTKSTAEYLKQEELTSKLTHLRDVGGFADHNAMACVSSSKYDEYLRALWGEADFYPTKSECWRVKYNDPVKATGSCADVGKTRDTTSLSQYSVLVCEFTTDGWFDDPIWMEPEEVNITDVPRGK